MSLCTVSKGELEAIFVYVLQKNKPLFCRNNISQEVILIVKHSPIF